MKKFYRAVLGHPKLIIAIFAILFVICGISQSAIKVDYDMNDYLPEDYYKDGNALFSVTIAEDKRIEAVDNIRTLIGDDNAMTGSAVSTATATQSTVKEISKIAGIAVAFVIFVLVITTASWFEPVVVMVGLGVAIIINAGSNLIFGEISFVTNAAGNILQLAVSLDYSVFLIHRFNECRQDTEDVKEAMVNALTLSTSSIASSGLTTVIGFLALCFMQFGIGPDLGRALAKGIAISLITVFVIVLVPSYLGSNENRFYYGASKIFGPETQLGADTEKIQDIFGKSDTYVLMVPKEDKATQKELSDALHEIPEVSSILSYVDTVGTEIPESYLDEATYSKLCSDTYTRLVLSVDAEYEGEETFALVEEIRSVAEEYYPGEWYPSVQASW